MSAGNSARWLFGCHGVPDLLGASERDIRESFALYSRADLIGWLVACDHNGLYTDERNAAADCDPLTRCEALDLVVAMLAAA